MGHDTLAPGRRGYAGAGGGADTFLHAPTQQRATTAQIRGLYPWVAGSGAPTIGVPLGRALRKTDGSAVTVCGDPISYFEGGLIGNPSATVIGPPSCGKSTLIRRILLVSAYWGTVPMVLGDVKDGGEYTELISGLGGTVVPVGRGRGYINVLDLGDAPEAAHQLWAAGDIPRGDALMADAKARRQVGVESLISVQRGREPSELECLLLGVALDQLDWRFNGKAAPLLGDLLALIVNPTDEMKDAALWRGDPERYHFATDPLRTSLAGLTIDSGLGAVFSRSTTDPIDRNLPMSFNLSGIDKGERKLRAAALLTCWAAGFGAIATSHALEDAGLEPARRRLVVTDELALTLAASPGLVERYRALSKLNRDEGVGTITAFHGTGDLESLESDADRAKAGAMFEHSGMLFCGGLPRSEMPRLTGYVNFTQREQDEMVSWSTPETWATVPRRKRKKPGEGKFLLKCGERPGIPFHLDLTPAELGGINDTDKRWHQ